MTRRTKILTAAALVLLFLAAWPAIAHYRAKWKLNHYKAELAARGEKLTIAELSPLVSADGIRAGHDLVMLAGQLQTNPFDSNQPPTMRFVAPGKAMVGWKVDPLPNMEVTNVWPALSTIIHSNQDLLEDIRAVVQAQSISFDLDFSQGYALLLPHLANLKHLAQWLSAATMLDLHEGRADEARENLLALIALYAHLKDEPLMISELVRIAIGQIALNVTWEALQYHRWPDQQWQELQTAWESIDLLTQAEAVLAMERAMGEKIFADGRQSYAAISSTAMFGTGSSSTGLAELAELGKDILDNPQDALRNMAHRYLGYWFWKYWQSYDDELANAQAIQAAIEAVRKIRREHRLQPALTELDQTTTLLAQQHPAAGKWLGESLLRERTFQRALSRIATLEAERSIAVAAIALERFHLKHGSFPAQLAALTPEFAKEIPRDTVDGQPLRYQPERENSFSLYSIGTDAVDNHGDASSSETSAMARRQWWRGRDMLWPQPASLEEARAELQNLAPRRPPQGPPPVAGTTNAQSKSF